MKEIIFLFYESTSIESFAVLTKEFGIFVTLCNMQNKCIVMIAFSTLYTRVSIMIEQ